MPIELTDLVATLIGGTAEWLVYTALLWIMIKLQRLNYHVLGLLGSSALATGLSYIPVAGCYISWAVLVICLWKCTRADIAPDVLFTVGIAGALMFCFHLFALGALMGHLRPDQAGDWDNPTEVAARTLDAEGGEEEAEDEPTGAPTSRPVPARQTTEAKSGVTLARNHPKAKQLALKGVSLRASQPLAMIASGARTYTVSAGESVVVFTPQGSVKIRCDEITRSFVMLTVGSNDTVKLTIE